MELRQLRCFVAVAEEGSFTRAAARLRLAQPGVSAQVRRLERELGGLLLDRAGRGVRLTQIGAAVLPYARAALEAAAGTRLAADAHLGLVRGVVRIGMVTACASRELLDALDRFHRQHPAVEVSLSEDRSDLLVEALRDGRLDLALVGVGGAPPEGIETRSIAEERLLAAVPAADPLASRASVALEELAGRPVICLPVGTGIRTRFDAGCAAARVHARVALEASSLAMVADLSARGLGVAILPESIARARAADLKAVPIAPSLRAGLAFAWRAGTPPSPAARALLARIGRPAGRGRRA